MPENAKTSSVFTSTKRTLGEEQSRAPQALTILQLFARPISQATRQIHEKREEPRMMRATSNATISNARQPQR